MQVYLDNAATTRVSGEAAAAVNKAMLDIYGNPSSGHRQGMMAAKLIDNARKHVAAVLKAPHCNIYFTSGGTEANNWAVFGAACLKKHEGKHIISTAIEHDSVLRPLAALEGGGWQVTYLKPGKDGKVSIQELEAALRPDTVLVSMMTANNETGLMQPVKEAAALLKRLGSGALLHTDHVQGFMKLDTPAKELGAHLISLSAHKVHGPKGVGALYVKEGLRLQPLILGGGQEGGMRSGTESTPLIAGFGEAARIGLDSRAESDEKLRALRDYTLNALVRQVSGVRILAVGETGNIISVSLPGYRSEVIVNFLDAKGIYISKSSACKRGGRSHVLTAMGLESRVIDGAFRVSFSRENTLEEAEYFVNSLEEARQVLLPSLK